MRSDRKVKVHIIYMAAGNSHRFGTNKLLTEWKGIPLFRYGLDTIHEFMHPYDNIDLTIVTQYKEILDYVNQGPPLKGEDCRRNRLPNLPYCRRYQAVMSRDSINGVSHTIQAGIYAADQTYGVADYYLFVVADQPLLKAETLQRMLDRVPCAEPVISASFKGRPCNPCMFSHSLVDELLKLTGDQGGRKVANANPCRFVEVSDESEIRDIDTGQDFPV